MKKKENQETYCSKGFNRSLITYRNFNKQQIEMSSDFLSAPAMYYKSLSKKHKRILPYFINSCVKKEYVFPTHAHVAIKCKCSKSTVKRALKKFKSSGLMASLYKHMSSCFYRISPGFYMNRVMSALKDHIPIFSYMFYLSLLLSSGGAKASANELNIKNELQVKRDIIKKEIILSSKRRSGSVCKSKVNNLLKSLGGVLRATPEERPNNIPSMKVFPTRERKKVFPTKVVRQRKWEEKFALHDVQATQQISDEEKGRRKLQSLFVEDYCKLKEDKRKAAELKKNIEIYYKIAPDFYESPIPLKREGEVPPLPVREDFIPELDDPMKYPMGRRPSIRDGIRVTIRAAERNFCKVKNLWNRYFSDCPLIGQKSDKFEQLGTQKSEQLGIQKFEQELDNSKRHERKIWVAPKITEDKEPVYISYYKMEDQFKKTSFRLANPYKGRFEEYVNGIIRDSSTSRNEIEDKLYKLYLDNCNSIKIL